MKEKKEVSSAYPLPPSCSSASAAPTLLLIDTHLTVPRTEGRKTTKKEGQGVSPRHPPHNTRRPTRQKEQPNKGENQPKCKKHGVAKQGAARYITAWRRNAWRKTTWRNTAWRSTACCKAPQPEKERCPQGRSSSPRNSQDRQTPQ